MKVKIYRGTHEIGGTCVELTAGNGKKLWIDLGAPLNSSNPDISYVKNRVDALLISHPHQDHHGLMENIGSEVPIFIGQLSLDLINAAKLFRAIPAFPGNFKKIEAWKAFTIADTFKVTPFLVDHSTPEAFAFLIDADNKRVFYSGDFRATGRKNILYKKLTDKPPGNIDLLLMEGTMVQRESHQYPKEDSVEQAMYHIFKEQKNSSFVVSSAQNIDRLVSVYRACKRTGKQLVIDIYTAWLLELVRKKSKNIPVMEWPEIKVYRHPGQAEKIKGSIYDTFLQRVTEHKTDNSVFTNPPGYVYFVRCPSEKLINRLKVNEIINIIYSQWEGYLMKEYEQYFTGYLNSLKADNQINFTKIHTSGHATVPDLIYFAKAIDPKIIVPIHTGYPETFKKEFEKEGIKNIILWEDGKEYEI